MSGNPVPAEGAFHFIQISEGHKRFLAGPLALGRDAQSWYISSNSVVLGDILAHSFTTLTNVMSFKHS